MSGRAIAGLLATAYHFVLSGLIRLVERIDARVPVYVVMPAAGVLVGLCYLLGHPGETDAVVNNIHVKNGRRDTRANLPLIPSSLVSVAAGGSAGPEAPVVYLTGSVGTWLDRWLALPERQVRALTLTGMGVGFATPVRYLQREEGRADELPGSTGRGRRSRTHGITWRRRTGITRSPAPWGVAGCAP